MFVLHFTSWTFCANLLRAITCFTSRWYWYRYV